MAVNTIDRLQFLSFIDNKTANINGKNCSLSIVLTAMDQKLQEIIKM